MFVEVEMTPEGYHSLPPQKKTLDGQLISGDNLVENNKGESPTSIYDRPSIKDGVKKTY